METADSLKIKFNCKEDTDLGALFNRGGSVVSVWRKKGLPAAIEKRAMELMEERGIVADPRPNYSVKMVDENSSLDDIEAAWLKRARKKGQAYIAKELARLIAEEEEAAESD